MSHSPDDSLRRKGLIKRVLIVFATLIVLFEEWIWDEITRLVTWLASRRLVARLERWIQTLSPIVTVLLFALPLVGLLPAKILAVYFLTHGQVMRGVVVLVVAKVIGTAVSARLFVLAKPKLMTFSTFVWIYTRVIRLKTWAHDRLESAIWYQNIRQILMALKQFLREWRVGIRHSLRRWHDRYFG
ncbi:MAG: hypothetical protein HQL73_06940 [Magnetococcales bacterium]|nr:hypothetical protein [Magnetococcales bacterium]